MAFLRFSFDAVSDRNFRRRYRDGGDPDAVVADPWAPQLAVGPRDREIVLLRRIYRAPELFQLLATFGGGCAPGHSQAAPPDADVERLMKAWAGRFTTVPPHDAALVRAFLIDSLRIDRYIDQRFTAAAQPTREEARARYAGAAPFESVEGDVRRRLAEERRLAMVRDWLKGLRERAVVRVLR